MGYFMDLLILEKPRLLRYSLLFHLLSKMDFFNIERDNIVYTYVLGRGMRKWRIILLKLEN